MPKKTIPLLHNVVVIFLFFYRKILKKTSRSTMDDVKRLLKIKYWAMNESEKSYWNIFQILEQI